MIYDRFDIEIDDDVYLIEFNKNECDVVTDFKVRQTVKNNIWSQNNDDIIMDDAQYDFFSVAIDNYLDDTFGE